MKVRQGRPTIAEIDRSALRWNLGQVQRRVKNGVPLMAVVKADAYGHGIAEVARVLEKEGVKAFGVATVEEGVAIRDAGVVHPEVLVLGGFVTDQVEPIFHHRLTPVVCDLEMATILAQRLRGSMRALPVHIKADTGLGRLGVPLAQMPVFLDEMRRIERLKIVGLCSHLGSAVDLATPWIERQVQAFIRAGELCAIHGSPVRLRHLANSAATLGRPDLHFEMVRPGIALYGLLPNGGSDAAIELRPAMRLRTRVLQLRRLPPGSGIGYDQTFVTERDSLIATLPIGYDDGYSRALSNRGRVIVRGQFAPVVGRVSMDLTLVDVTDIQGVQLDDRVTLLGSDGDRKMSADELGAAAGTISYEITCGISNRVPRIYLDETAL